MKTKTVAVAHYLSRLALCFWIGEMLFFAIVFAPRVFRVLPREMAAHLQNTIFPAYFTGGLVSALVLAVTMPFWRKRESRKPKAFVPEALLLFAAAVFAYSLWVLSPQISELSPYLNGVPPPELREKFAGLHRLSVQMNGAALLALLVLLAFV